MYLLLFLCIAVAGAIPVDPVTNHRNPPDHHIPQHPEQPLIIHKPGLVPSHHPDRVRREVTKVPVVLENSTPVAVPPKPVAVPGSGGKEPVGEEHGPVVGENVPVGGENVPVGGENVPVGGDNVPFGEEHGPVVGENVPVGEEHEHVPGDEDVPVGVDNVPMEDGVAAQRPLVFLLPIFHFGGNKPVQNRPPFYFLRPSARDFDPQVEPINIGGHSEPVGHPAPEVEAPVVPEVGAPVVPEQHGLYPRYLPDDVLPPGEETVPVPFHH